jgi:hypothetical protein
MQSWLDRSRAANTGGTFSRYITYGRWYCCDSSMWQMELGWMATSPMPSCHPGRLPVAATQAGGLSQVLEWQQAARHTFELSL